MRIGCCFKTSAARMKVNIGVVALRMDASPVEISVCPQKSRENGIALLSSPIIASDARSFQFSGNLCLEKASTM